MFTINFKPSYLSSIQSANDNVGYTRLKDLPKATKMAFSHLPFLFITIGGCTQEFVIAAVTPFGPKLLEAQFYVPAGRAALLYGLVAVPAALFGNMLGEYTFIREEMVTIKCTCSEKVKLISIILLT